jgi:hypothetical protein
MRPTTGFKYPDILKPNRSALYSLGIERVACLLAKKLDLPVPEIYLENVEREEGIVSTRATCGSSPSSRPWLRLYAVSLREAAQRSRLVGLALRPGSRPKARRPPNCLDARGNEPRRTEFDSQGQPSVWAPLVAIRPR